jgi:hypothetical protein
MKRLILLTSVSSCLAFNSNAQNITVFSDNFGATIVRQTSPYMPTPGFAFGNPNGTDLEKAIENNYYAVIDPTHIKDNFPVPYWWFWTGPEPTGNTFGSVGNAATNDHTGNANGAVMVINAGTTLTSFYDRTVNLQNGGVYKLSWWIYLVNSPCQIAADIKDYATNTTLASMPTTFFNTSGAWTQFSVTFNEPSSCTAGGVRIVLRNALSQNQANDYYIDDILLEKLPNGSPSPNTIVCPTADAPIPLSVNLINFKLKNDAGNVYLDWTAADEVNLESYIVQKSTDGINFSTLSQIPAKNNASLTNYRYTDHLAAVAEHTMLFYRLAIRDIDGTTKFSNILRTNTDAASNLSLYPNPMSNGQMSITGLKTGDILTITDPLGRMLQRINASNAAEQINLSGLNLGVYIISVLHTDGTIEYLKALNQK